MKRWKLLAFQYNETITDLLSFVSRLLSDVKVFLLNGSDNRGRQINKTLFGALLSPDSKELRIIRTEPIH